MKNIYGFFFLLLSCVYGLQAQVVSIPDANFLNKLITLGVDTNADGQIQTAEALAISYLNVSGSNINNITGIQSFINLDTFICFLNLFTNLAVSNLTNLQYLDCNYNAIGSLDVNNLTNLQHLNCEGTNLGSLNVSNNTALTFLNCGNIQMASLDVSNNPNLTVLNCNANVFISLDVSNNLNLTELRCQGNLITSLDVSNNTILTYLYCASNAFSGLDVSNNTNLATLICGGYSTFTSLNVGNNSNLTYLAFSSPNLTSIDVSGLPNLEYLFFDNTPLTNLDISNNTNLTHLYCHDTQLTSLDVSNNTNLTHLGCSDNQLTSLDLSNNTNLISLGCSYNQLSSLDVSNCLSLDTLNCSGNLGMLTLFIKNGSNETNLNFSSNPNLQYICADASQLASVQQQLVQFGMTNVILNGFCSVTPNGNYNTISGTSTYDADVNGCSPLDSAYSFLKVKITDGTSTGYFYTDSLGNYKTYMDTGTYTLTPQFQNPAYFTSTPASTNINFPNNNFNLQTQDFCIAPNGVHPDVEIIIMPITNAVAGIPAEYKLIFLNKGTTTVSGNISLDFMGTKMNFVSASINPTTQTLNQLTWAYSNLQPFETRNIYITMNLLPPPTNNLGDSLYFTANIPLANDVTNDNYFMLSQEVMGAYDPNDKTCLEGPLVSNDYIGDYLHYLVRFQNTGNLPAQNVVIADSIYNSSFLISSVQLLATSHPAQIRIENGMLQFHFENIMLPDSFSNEPASHGYVLFKVRTKSNLALNSIVKNHAEIYFDYNLPVITNTAVTTFGGFTSVTGTKTNATCFGAADGSLNLVVTGGVSPYLYGIGGAGGTFQSSPNFTGLVAGIYHCIVIDSLGFTDIVNLTITQPAASIIVANFTSVVGALGQVSFTNTSSNNATSYFWDFGNGATDTNENPVYTYPSNGSYNVMLIASNPCGSDTSYQTIVVSTVGIVHTSIEGDIRVFPNPAKDELNVSAQFEKPTMGKVVLYDLVGKAIVEKAFEYGIGMDIKMPLSDLATGTYILVIETDLGTYVGKIVKE